MTYPITRLCALAVAGSALVLAAAHAADGKTGAENSNKSIWTQDVTSFRKDHAVAGGYTKKWDLSDLPHYKPKHQLKGKLRVWGNNYIKDGYLGEYWRAAFKKFQPGIEIEYNLPTTGIAIPSLSAKASDVAMSRKAILMDLLTFEQVYKHPITEVSAVTGSYDVYGWMPAFTIVVNKDNPLERISMKQLDGVFGGQRNGGYDASVWRTDYNTVQLSDKITRGSDQWNEGYQAYANYIDTDGKIVPWSTQARDAIAKDKYALFYVSPLSMSPDLKELAIQGWDGGPYVKRSLETIRDHSYPLYAEYYFYLNRDPGKPVDPKVDEFLHFILSQEGQDEVQREGRYMPLTGEMVRAQLKKLE